MTDSNFDRFEDQCRNCPCYIENIEEGAAYDPDQECTLGHGCYGETRCDDFGG